jgi:hypothetical protein
VTLNPSQIQRVYDRGQAGCVVYFADASAMNVKEGYKEICVMLAAAWK